MSLNPDQYNNSLNDQGVNWCSAITAQPSGDFGTPGSINDDCSVITIVDVDGDGYESDSESGGTDCDDNDSLINPGAADIAGDGIDQDCDGADAVSTASDADGDGYDSNSDCDDTDPAINPGMLDIGGDTIDQDCSGTAETGLCFDLCGNAAWNGDGECDDGGPNADYSACGFGADCSDCGPRYDLDEDGYYDDEGVGATNPYLALDCDDTDPNLNPGELDISGDTIDQDCSGDAEEGLCSDTCSDAADGYCDDGGPFADTSICSFGSDCSDCGAREDNDGDGFYDDMGTTPLDPNVSSQLDCDDDDADINPNATETANDSIDQDCDGVDLQTSVEMCDDSCGSNNDGVCDDDGFLATNSSCDLGTDCTDCGSRYDSDLDGYDSDQDCNDSDPLILPGATDVCDGVDNDCDGIIDGDTDILEPNWVGYPYYMGALDDKGDSLSLNTYMTHDNDQDAFSLYLFDPSDWLPPDEDDFECVITPPSNIDIMWALMFDGTVIDSGNSAGSGGAETIFYDAGFGRADAGVYTIVIESTGGSSCSAPVSIYCEKPD
jgi:hypothetical protein